jgi:hypothetical protein
MKIVIAAMLCCCIPLLYPTLSNACQCSTRSVSQRIKESQAVFVGTVIGREQRIDNIGNARGWRVTLAIEQYWKGEEAKEITIYTGPDNCVTWFELKKKYLVFAYLNKEKARLETNVCMGTGRIEMSKEDLKKLGKGKIVRAKIKASSDAEDEA